MFLALQEVVRPPFVTLDQTAPPDILGALLVCFFTLAVFSFLYRDNPFYKLAEHVFVGLGTAYFTLQYYEEGIKQPIYEYLFEDGVWDKIGTDVPVVLGGFEALPEWAFVFRIGAAVFGLMLLLRLVAPNSWAPRWPLAIMVGVYAALKMTGETQSKLVLLVGNTLAFNPLYNPDLPAWSELQGDWIIEEWWVFDMVARLIFFVGLLCALAHFIFTYRRTRLLSGVSKVGIVTLMITFGAMFGFTVLGRIALLIERVSDLESYTRPPYSLLPGEAGAEQGWLSAALTPPFLIGAIIVLALVVGARRAPAGGPPVARAD